MIELITTKDLGCAKIKEFSSEIQNIECLKKNRLVTNPDKVEFSITDFEVFLSQILSKIKSKFVYI